MFVSRISNRTFFLSIVKVAVVGLGLVGTGLQVAKALPWDVDMFRQESLQANEVARNPVKGTVPIGRTVFHMTTEEADAKLKNTEPYTLDSVWRGQRVFNSNCATCHGAKGDAQSPVGKQLPVPNLLEDFYKGRSDGRIFGVVRNGGAVMPKYGFKFSDREIWDAINYVRFLQGRAVDSPSAKDIERPK